MTLTSFKPMLVPYATFWSVFIVEYAVLVDIDLFILHFIKHLNIQLEKLFVLL